MFTHKTEIPQSSPCLWHLWAVVLFSQWNQTWEVIFFLHILLFILFLSGKQLPLQGHHIVLNQEENMKLSQTSWHLHLLVIKMTRQHFPLEIIQPVTEVKGNDFDIIEHSWETITGCEISAGKHTTGVFEAMEGRDSNLVSLAIEKWLQ